MKVKLQPPSNTELPAFNPILPPAAITQILLLANPQKVLTLIRLLTTFTSLCWFFLCGNVEPSFFFSCVSGKSAFALQADIQPGGQISRWIWWRRPLPSSKHLGQPLVRRTTLLSSDSAASFRFMLKLSLITGSGKTALYTSVSVWWRRLTWDQLWEPASTLCLAPQPSHRCSIRSIFPVCHSLFLPQQSDQTVIRCQKNIQCGDVWENNLSL